jgi:phenylpropionate dioxygenase-like ring-hydroxylating dioxygenase large terminal subunit
MGMLDHWHPVHPSRKLKPGATVGIQLAGRLICLYRTESGAVAAVDDVCPHRRLKLSYGTVVGEHIQCKYHGWKFDPCGYGESPSTPKMTACTEAFDTREEHGYVWVKSKASDPVFPEINKDKYYPLGTFYHECPAPLELTLDNFNEIEHSGTVHDTFGYDLDRMHEVRVRFETTDTSVRVINVGPTKRIFRPFAWLLGIRDGDLFHDDWTTHFSPVYSVFDHWWTSPDGGRESMIRWRLYIFYYPIDPMRTAVVSFVYAKSKYPGPTGGLRLAKPLFRMEVDREIQQDINMLRHMGSLDTGIEGLKLSRFDKVLGLTRERINKIYRGTTPASQPLANGRVPLIA